MEEDNITYSAKELFDQAKFGDVDYVDKALANKIDPNWQNPDYFQRTALHHASEYNNTQIIRSLLAAGASKDLQDRDGETAIYVASSRGKTDSVTTLIDCGADINIANDTGMTPVMIASNSDNLKIVEALIDAHANVNQINNSGRTALHRASQYNQSAIIRLLVAAGANKDLQDTYGETPIYAAAGYGKIDAVTTLIDCGADINIAAKRGITPVMIAGAVEIVEVLIDAHANLSQIDDSGQTALHLAANCDYSKVIPLLMQKGLDPRQQDNDGMTLVDYAKKRGYHELVTIMVGEDVEITELDMFNAAERGDVVYVEKALGNKIDPNWKNPDFFKRSALHQASENNNPAIVRLLVAAGANINLQDVNGKTSLYLALRDDWGNSQSNLEVVTTLIELGADVEIASDGGVTPVMIAKHISTLEALIDAHVNLKQIDDSGKTALHWAPLLGNRLEIVQLLLQKGLDQMKQDKDGMTPVDYAKQKGYFEMVTMMVGDHVEITEQDLFYAARRGDTEHVEKALANKINPNWQNPDNCQRTALHQASSYNHPMIVKSLVAAGADINLQDKFGCSPMYLASESPRPSFDALTTLIDLGADVEISNDGKTPVMVAEDINIVEILIDAHANINQIDDSGKTALHWAADCDCSEKVQLLLQKGLDPRQQDNKGLTPVDYAKEHGYHELVTIMVGDDVKITELDLFNAVSRGDVEYVDKALTNKTDPNWQNPDYYQRTALHRASYDNDPVIIRSLVAAGANTDLQDEDDETPIYLASNFGKMDALTALIDCGADINIGNDVGKTPLMIASSLEIVEALIDAHANLSQTDCYGRNVLHLAVKENQSEKVQLLLQKGLDPRKQEKYGMTPVDCAKELGYHKIVTMMVGDDVEITELDLYNAAGRGDLEYVDKALANKIDPNWQNPDFHQWTALHWVSASTGNNTDTIRMLLAAGANKDLQDDRGWTPIYVASNGGKIHALTTLIDCGADINIVADGGITPVMIAELVEIVEALIDAHANLGQTDDFGRTALHWAVQKDQLEKVSLLLHKGIDTTKQDNDGLTAADYARNLQHHELLEIINSTVSTSPTDQPSTSVQ